MQKPVRIAFAAVLGPQKDIYLTLFTPPLICISRGDQRLRATVALGLPAAAAHSLWADINAHILSSAEPLAAAGGYVATWEKPCIRKSVYKIDCARRGLRGRHAAKGAVERRGNTSKGASCVSATTAGNLSEGAAFPGGWSLCWRLLAKRMVIRPPVFVKIYKVHWVTIPCSFSAFEGLAGELLL